MENNAKQSGMLPDEQKEAREKQIDRKEGGGRLARRLTAISLKAYAFLGLFIILVSTALFLYFILRSSYDNTGDLAKGMIKLIEGSDTVPVIVRAVLEQERSVQGGFEQELKRFNPADIEGQLLNYRWYVEENPPLARLKEYEELVEYFYAFGESYRHLNGTSLMVFDKQTHIAALLCDVEKFGKAKAIPQDYILWRTFEEAELDQIEAERGSLFQNLMHYMSIDPRYVAFAWYEPYPWPDDQVIVFVETDAFYTNVWSGILYYLIAFILLLLAVIALIGVFSRRRITRVVVDPVNRIAASAKHYVRDRRLGISGQAHFAELRLSTGDELEELAGTMAEMEREISVYEENLTRITAEREHLAAELDVAGKLQSDMLPKRFPLFPERKEFDLYASMDPAKEVGGDFYDVFLIDEDHLCMLIADVSGKGVPAALFMVKAITELRTRAGNGGSPAQILYDVNNSLIRGNKTKMFVTVWLGILTISTGEVTEANAGHENPAISGKDGDYSYIVKKHGFVLGGKKNTKYQDDTFRLENGGTLFVYTDGLTEATNADGERFAKERLLMGLNETKGQAAAEVVAHMKQRVEEFVSDAPQFDDLTMLALKWVKQ